MRVTRFLLCVALLLLALPLVAQSEVQVVGQRARDAYKAKDFAGYLAESRRLEVLRPGHPVVLFNLAGAYSLNGDAAAATRTLGRLAALRVTMDVAGEADFDKVRANPSFAAAAARIAAVHDTSIQRGEVAFTFDDRDLLTESIVFDPVTRSFLVSSVRKRRVLRIAADGTMSDFVGADAGIDSPNGLAIDAAQRRLWVVTTGSIRMEGFAAAHANRPALLAFSLDSGKLLQKIEAEDAKSYFDSVAVIGSDVVVSDGAGTLLVLRNGEGALRPLVPAGLLRSPQAIAPLDARTFFVADYGSGIWRVDLVTGAATRLKTPDGVLVYGIDGLSYADGSLFAVVNGYNPSRVQRLTLDRARRSIVSAELLEMSSRLDEPTNGTIANHAYYVLASSQGHRFDNAEVDPKSSGAPTVLKFALPH